jgi:hypothetical protein
VLYKQLNGNKSVIAVVYIIGLEVCHRVILVVAVDILFKYCLKIIFSILFFDSIKNIVCVHIYFVKEYRQQ